MKKYSQAKEFLIIIGKSKNSLHGLTPSDFSPTTDTWQWLLSFQHFKCTFCVLGIFFENRKNSCSSERATSYAVIRGATTCKYTCSIRNSLYRTVLSLYLWLYFTDNNNNNNNTKKLLIIPQQCLWCCRHDQSHCGSPGSFDKCKLSAGWPPTLASDQAS